MSVSYPRCWLSLNGGLISCIHASVTRKSQRSADTFTAELSITETAKFGMDLASWADYHPSDVSIIMSSQASAADQTTMVTGEIDVPHIHWSNMTVTVSGRDKSSKLIEKRVSKKYNNQKASDIVSQIAQDVGLTPSVVGTSDFAGKIYDTDTVHLALNRTYFEILSDLADREGCRWYVDASTLYFEPKEQDSDVFSGFWAPPGTVAPYGVSTLLDLETFRNMTAARPHEVNVKSWHHKDKKQYASMASAAGIGESVEIEHHHNGRNQEQVERLAKSRLKDAIRHDCNLVAKAPGDLGVTPRMKFQLSGTGTIYDQTYDIDSVTFDMGWQAPFTMDLECKTALAGRDDSGDGGGSGGSALGQGGIGHA